MNPAILAATLARLEAKLDALAAQAGAKAAINPAAVYSVREAAALLPLSAYSLRERIRLGALPAKGRPYRLRGADLLRLCP